MSESEHLLAKVAQLVAAVHGCESVAFKCDGYKVTVARCSPSYEPSPKDSSASMAWSVRNILREHDRPMPAKEIADFAVGTGLTKVRNRIHTALHSMKLSGKVVFDEATRMFSLPG